MSIATAITNLQGKIANAYTAIENKGGTLPATQDAANLSATIDAIPAGGSPIWGIKSLEEVCCTDNDGNIQMFKGLSGDLNFTGATAIPEYGLNRMFINSGVKSATFPSVSSIGTHGINLCFASCDNLVSVSFPELKTAHSINNTFANCGSLSSVSFPMLSSISTMTSSFFNCTSLQQASFPSLVSATTLTYTFQGCKSLTSISFPALSSVSNLSSMCDGCSSLVSVSFPSLISAVSPSEFYYAFNGCTSLTSVSFPEMTIISSGTGHGAFSEAFPNGEVHLSFPKLSAIIGPSQTRYVSHFYECSGIVRIDFPNLTVLKVTPTATTNDLTRLFNLCPNLVEIHFGAENQAIIEASDGYATMWGAPNANCQVYFDL